MIQFRKLTYFDKYLDIINEKNRFLHKHDYYIKIPAKYDVKYWVLAALKKKLFDESQKTYFDLDNKEVSAEQVKKAKTEKGKGGILIFPNDTRIILRYLHNPVKVFKNRAVKKIFKKYPDGILWHLGNRYRGVYQNKPRNIMFNADSDTLEILNLGSGDLINIAVKIANQHKQPILLIKDMNNEQMIILGKRPKDGTPTDEKIFGQQDEQTDFDIKKLKYELNETYKLCPAYMHTLWEMSDVYPKLEEFWVEGANWYGR